ncbi:WAT1-related protein At3g30340-like [Magnolia sinica]|uniref:WAT1-related protein At3g30340-like n=1 Tax=Magnolia sinica TaxID=86752 RepID=UPI00265A2651|nr:WAT1-related protein At3g30340-like [Magnolia sinica]
MADCKCTEWRPAFAMVAVQVAFAIVNILLKKVLDQGLNHLVLVTYRQTVATVFIAPIALFKERKTRPKLTTRIFSLLFVSSMLGATLTQYFFLIGMDYTSATFACAFINLVPVVTFIMALPFGLETANVKNKAGRAKVFGAVVCVGSAMLLTFYKGVALTNTSHSPAISNVSQHNRVTHEKKEEKWTIGSMALIGGCLCWSTWFLLQAKISNIYPSPYSSTTIISSLSALQSVILGLAIHRDISLWTLNGTLMILTVVYAGIVGSGLCYVVMSWCVEKRGPVFTAAFGPLVQIIVAIIDFSVLHEQLHLGSVLGSLLVIIGLYILLWGKSMEGKNYVAKQVEMINYGGGESAA